MKQSGLTLIELMVVVAIIGILAAIAIPQYQAYVTRARWQDVIVTLASFKTAIAECAQNNSGQLTDCDSVPDLVNGQFYPTTALPTNKYGGVVTYPGLEPASIQVAGGVELANCTLRVVPQVSAPVISWIYRTSDPNCSRQITGFVLN